MNVQFHKEKWICRTFKCEVYYHRTSALGTGTQQYKGPSIYPGIGIEKWEQMQSALNNAYVIE